MSKNNPKKAMAALLPLELDVGYGLAVKPMTLGMYAALERIGSPMVTGDEPKDTLDLIPSLYLITHDPREVFKGNVLELAMAWADTVPVDVVARIREAVYRQLGAMTDVIPQLAPEELKKKRRGNDGWIAYFAGCAAEFYGWSYEEIMWEVPASAIALLIRQQDRNFRRTFPLSEIEKIDNGDEEA